MALLSKQKTISDFLTKGIVGDITSAWGIGAGINFADDRTGHHLKNIGINLGRTVNGQPLGINLTDAVFVLATTGLNLGGKGMFPMLIKVGAKKLGEAFGIILDDPLPTTIPRPQKAPLPEINLLSNAANNYVQMPAMSHGYSPGTFGGINA